MKWFLLAGRACSCVWWRYSRRYPGLPCLVWPMRWGHSVEAVVNGIEHLAGRKTVHVDGPRDRPVSPRNGAFAADLSGRARVIDGDTIDIGGARVRLHGVDAPESAQGCLAGGERWPCGSRATRALAQRIDGRTVACEERDLDRYGTDRCCVLAGRPGCECVAGCGGLGAGVPPVLTSVRGRGIRGEGGAQGGVEGGVRRAPGIGDGGALAGRRARGAWGNRRRAGPLQHQGEHQPQEWEAHLPHARRQGLRTYANQSIARRALVLHGS